MKKILFHLKKNWIKYGFETLVVIVGVLSAFALSDWNETRKTNKIKTSYLERLRTDLVGDNKNLANLIGGRKSHLGRIEAFRDLFNSGIYGTGQLKDSATLVGRGFHRYLPLDITYQELISSGSIGLFSEELRIALAELDRTKDFYVIINAQMVGGLFARDREVAKYWNLSGLDFSSSLMKNSNEEEMLKGLRLELNAMKDSYDWNRENIGRYEELMAGNNKLISLIDLELHSN